jgi:hypothetical protein
MGMTGHDRLENISEKTLYTVGAGIDKRCLTAHHFGQ